MLIGVQTAKLNAQVTFVNIAVAISPLAGGLSKKLAPSPYIAFWRIFACRKVKKVRRCNFGSLWEVFGNGKTDKNEGFGMLEH